MLTAAAAWHDILQGLQFHAAGDAASRLLLHLCIPWLQPQVLAGAAELRAASEWTGGASPELQKLAAPPPWGLLGLPQPAPAPLSVLPLVEIAAL